MNDDAASTISRVLEAGTLNKLGDAALEWVAPELFFQMPKLVFLRGEMGSGKTSFVAKVAEVLGSDEAASPSFALHTRYEGVRGTIDHFDLDRLSSIDDLESTGFWDIIADQRARLQADPSEAARSFVMIEWAKRLDEFGAGTEGAPWTAGFRSWSFQFEGPPGWRLMVRRLA